MSAECHIHGVDLLGFMDTAYCPVCRIAELQAVVAAHLARIKWLDGEVARYMATRTQDQREVERLRTVETVSRIVLEKFHPKGPGYGTCILCILPGGEHSVTCSIGQLRDALARVEEGAKAKVEPQA